MRYGHISLDIVGDECFNTLQMLALPIRTADFDLLSYAGNRTAASRNASANAIAAGFCCVPRR